MSLHVFTAEKQPATNYTDRCGVHAMRFKNPASKLLPTCCCRKRLPARDLTAQCFYDQTLFSCRDGKGCKAPKKAAKVYRGGSTRRPGDLNYVGPNPWPPRKPRKPLAPMSAKTKAKQPARRACCAAVRQRSGGRCEVALPSLCAGRMDHTHEINPRSNGGSITDPTNCLAICAPCHRWVHGHSNAARELGFLI